MRVKKWKREEQSKERTMKKRKSKILTNILRTVYDSGNGGAKLATCSELIKTKRQINNLL